MASNAARLLELFQGRQAEFAQGYARETEEGLKLVYNPSKRPLTEADLEAHIEGKGPIVGVYLLREDSLVKFCAIDLDQRDLPKIESARNAAIELGVPEAAIMLVDSGAKGYHLHIFFAEWTPARQARELLRLVLKTAAIAANEVEIFPKQAGLSTHQPYGSLIKLPLAIHPVSGRRASLVNARRVTPMDPEALAAIVPLPAPETPETHATNGERPHLEVLQGGGGAIAKGQRNVYLTEQAGRLRAQGLSPEAIETLINAMNQVALEQPLPAAEVKAILHSMESWPVGDYTKLPPPASGPKIDFFDDHGAFVPPRLGAFLHSECPIWPGPDGRLYRYVNGVYRGDGETWAKERIRDLMGDKFRRRHQDEVMTWLRAGLALGARPDPAFINLPNGLLEWRTGELRPHSPDLASIIRIPVRWETTASCPAISRFLQETLPEDAIEFVLEVIGYGLIPANPLQKAVLLLGPGGNGKGTLLHVIRALYGAENVSTRTLHDLGDDRFAAADLYGRLANICGDLDARTVERSDIFKMVTGGDPITGERKYASAFTFSPFALLIFSANQAPLSSDQTRAYFDRWLVVPMTRRFRDTEAEDSGLGAKLSQPEELEGLLQLAVNGLRRLMKRGRFAVPGTVQEAGEGMRAELDTVLAFCSEWCVFHEDASVPRNDLYGAYEKWCQSNGRRPLGSRNVYGKLLQVAGVSEYRTTYERGFRGVRIGPGG